MSGCARLCVLFSGCGGHRRLHVLTQPVPTRRAADLTPEPVATALNYVLGNVPAGSSASHILGTLKILVVFAALAGLSSVVLVMLMGQPRIFYSMSRDGLLPPLLRSEEHTSELQSLMRISYAVFCLKKKKTTKHYK